MSYSLNKIMILSIFVFLSYGGDLQANSNKCSDKITQTDMNICKANELEEVTSILDDTYSKLLYKADSSEKQILNNARNAWQIYRDQQCKYNNFATRGGSVHSMMLSICMIRLTNDYIAILNEQINCQEGDLACNS